MPVSFRVEEDSPSSSSEGDENPDESFTEAEEAAMRSLSHTGRGHVEVGSAKLIYTGSALTSARFYRPV